MNAPGAVSHRQPYLVGLRLLKPGQAYALPILATAVTLGLRLALEVPLHGQPTLVMFTLPIMLSAYAGGWRGGLLATSLSCLAAQYFLLSPVFTWRMAATGELWQLFFVAVAGVVISVSMGGLHGAQRRTDIVVREYQEADAPARPNEQRLRQLIDGLGPSMFVGLLTPQGTLIEINQAPLTVLGLNADDVLGQPFEETPWWAHSPAVQRQLREAITRGALGEAFRYDLRTRGVANDAIDIDFSLRPLRDETGRVVFLVASAIVITERKQAEDALRESNEKFHLLADHITDVFWIRSPDMRELHYLSPAFERIWGRTVESLHATPQQWSDFIVPEDRERVLDEFTALTANKPSLDIEYRIVRPDQEIRWIRARGFQVRDAADTLIRNTGIVTDITERKRVETALQESEERYRALVDWSPEAIVVQRDGQLLFVNPAAVTLIGATSADELIGTAMLDLVHPAFHDTVPAPTTNNANDGDVMPLVEQRLIKLDGTPIEVEVHGIPIVYEGAEATYTSIRDITERKRAVAALRSSMEEVRSLAEAIPQMVWISRPDGWTVYFNQQWTDYTGLTLEESLGHGWATPLHPEDQKPAWDAWQHATATSGTFSIESRVRRADGIYRWWLVRGVPQQDAAGQILKWFATCTDIHDLKLAELEISRVNRALKMLSRCNDALIRAEHEQALLDQICRIAVENGGYRMAWVGYAQDDPARSVTPVARAGVEETYLSEIKVTWNENEPLGQGPAGQAIRTGQAVVHEDVARAPSFAPWLARAQQSSYRGIICLPLRNATRTFGLLALYSAEVNRTSAEELTLLLELADNMAFGIGNLRLQIDRHQLATQVREQAALLDIASEAILVKDLTGRIVYWNKGAERTYGWSAADVVGRMSAELLYPDSISYHQAQSTLLATGEWHGELINRTKDGRNITVEARWTLVRNAEGRPKSILAINTDITEKKVLESQFLRAQRMEGIGTLAGGIAHDLNNVLAPIVMSIEMLKELVKDQEGLMLLDTLQGSAQRGSALVKQVLSFARGVEGQRIAVNPVDVICDLVAVMRDTFPKSIDVRFTPARDLWTVIGDSTQIHQVFLNLCVNARDAMADGGTLTIGMDNVVLNDSDTRMNPGSRPGAYMRVKIEDSGTGIPTEIRDRVFEPFFTTKAFGKGTGLGLSTTLAIVKSHGGFINLYSAVGQGTAFSVYLPATALVPAGRVAAEESLLPRGNGELILVVDDEEAIRSIAQQTLQRFGYRVVVACNGAEAIDLYARRPNEVAVVLTDMAMPVVDGPALIAALRAVNPDVRIVGSSGLMPADEAGSVLGAGVQYFVPKPYTASAILKALQSALRAQTSIEEHKTCR